MILAHNNPGFKSYFQNKVCPNTEIPDIYVDKRILEIDFSRKGAYWNAVVANDVKMRASSEIAIRTVREMVFHATWNTQRKELGLVQKVTGHDFQTRREIGKQLLGRESGREIRGFPLIKWQVVCKLSNSQTEFLSGGKEQIFRAPTLSLKCTQSLNLYGDLFKTLMTV